MTYRIELIEHGAGKDASVMLAEMKARFATQKVCDEQALNDFCDRLRGYTFRTPLSETRDKTPFPAGYDNVQVFDANDGTMIGSRWTLGSDQTDIRVGAEFSAAKDRPTAASVISICLAMHFEEVTAWRSTRVLSSSGAGVLNLAVDIDIRPRQRLVDGFPLPPELVTFLASRARSHG